MRTDYLDVQERLQDKIFQVFMNDKSVWSQVEFFEPTEFENAAKVDPLLLVMLDCTRWEATRAAGREVKIKITSDYREGDDATHGEKPFVGVDIRAKKSRDRFHIIRAAILVGFTRIGLVKYGGDEGDWHIHLDIGERVNPEKYDAEVMW